MSNSNGNFSEVSDKHLRTNIKLYNIMTVFLSKWTAIERVRDDLKFYVDS